MLPELTHCPVCFAGPVHYAENELLLPTSLRVPGRVCGARPEPGPPLTCAPFPSLHRPVGGRPDQGLPPPPHHLNQSGTPAVDEQLRGAAELRGPVLSLPCVHHSALAAGAVHRGGAVGVAHLGKGRWMCFTGLDTVAGPFLASTNQQQRPLCSPVAVLVNGNE